MHCNILLGLLVLATASSIAHDKLTCRDVIHSTSLSTSNGTAHHAVNSRLSSSSLAGTSQHVTNATLSSSSIGTSQHVLKLTRKLAPNRAAAAVSRLQSGHETLISAELSKRFCAQISVGNQSFEVVVDTGSDITWLVMTGFTCVNKTDPDHATLAQADCDFGPLFEIDRSFTPIPNENLKMVYLDGDHVNGIMGYATVTVAGIDVPHQEIGVADLAAWNGDGVSSGLLGLAFSRLTSSYPGTNGSADVATTVFTNVIKYPSIFDRIFELDKLTRPLFALALSRDESNTSYGGVMTIGGIPSVADPTINASSTFTSTPIEDLATQFIDAGWPEYFYTINVTNVLYGPAPRTAVLHGAQFIIDSGTTLIYLPTPVAIAFNALFDPPATGYDVTGYFLVDCNATAPPFAVTISGNSCNVQPSDLVWHTRNGYCMSAIQAARGSPNALNILGDAFLRNVLAVHDWGNLEMQ